MICTASECFIMRLIPFFFSSRRRHTRSKRDWSSDVCSSDLRVRALGRRYAEEPALSLHVADLALDLVDHRVHRGGRLIELTARELTLLKVLMREPGRVFTRTELCERVWEHPHDYDTKLVEVFIGRLRKKIGDPPLIHTVRHVGYTIDESITLAGA